jgi:hypothetical protein
MTKIDNLAKGHKRVTASLSEQISEIPPDPPLEKGGWGDLERIPRVRWLIRIPVWSRLIRVRALESISGTRSEAQP